MPAAPASPPIFGLDDRPPPAIAAFVGLQHVLAVFGGIVTAPLLIALGMGLPSEDTTYLISASLVVSGLATIIQIVRVGQVGSGLLSIQGTSFTFVGPLIFLYQSRIVDLTPGQTLGRLFAACAICSIAIALLSRVIDRLHRVMTPRVAAATILLIGVTLVNATLGNILREVQTAAHAGPVLLLAGTVLATIALIVLRGGPRLRMASVVVGLAVGTLLAAGLGLMAPLNLETAAALFIPELGRYPWSIDLTMIAVLLPVFLISATESIGDLTATSALSMQPVRGPKYWSRIRGGILADALNSLLAAALSTFPNTTFSQNNGVIRITGVCARRVGLWTAAFLVLIGSIPLVAALLQALPGAVIGGATLLMFFMVAVSGARIALADPARRRATGVVLSAVIGGLALGAVGPHLHWLPDSARMLISFPVSSGAFIAMLIELALGRDTTAAWPEQEHAGDAA